MSAQPVCAPHRLLLIAPPLLEKDLAFDRARMLAKAKGSALHIVAFDYLEGLATAGLVNEQALHSLQTDYVERHHQWLQAQAQAMRLSDIEVTVEVQWVEDPLPEILAHVQEMPASLVIKAVQPVSLLKRTLFTPLDLHLARQCRVPMHFVASAEHAMPRRVMAAVDPFDASAEQQAFNEQIIYEALKLGMQCKAEVHLVYAYDLSSMAAADGGVARGALLSASVFTQQFYDAQVEAFNALADRNGFPVANRHMVLGSPGRALSDFARDQQMDVVVMGRVHRHGLLKLLGSTADHLLYTMPGSVLMLPFAAH
ncbi:universal stress protein [Pseudomonas turukhanskensis]|uniref:Universal stress protein n=1 Tax=Pseudomonas turukhanskensis TaxID=1806536 RepID=A0A9W6NF65_9PSED|nr:universal stress protein [Pseudomonas turukhanskensis]GLK88495.1 universal stress protein [Pseudomonas turukhanskensis]